MAWEGKAEEKERLAADAMAHVDHLYRLAFHLARDKDEAQDLVQETFARALSSYRQFAPGSNMKAWLTKILYNLFLDRYHERRRWVSAEAENFGQEEKSDYWERVPAENPGPESLLLIKELNIKIADAVKKIPEEFRAAVLLVDMGDFSYAEAAEILSCPVGTVRSRLSRGRRLLYRLLRSYAGLKEKG